MACTFYHVPGAIFCKIHTTCGRVADLTCITERQQHNLLQRLWQHSLHISLSADEGFSLFSNLMFKLSRDFLGRENGAFTAKHNQAQPFGHKQRMGSKHNRDFRDFGLVPSLLASSEPLSKETMHQLRTPSRQLGLSRMFLDSLGRVQTF